MEKTEEEYELEIEQIHNMFPKAKFEIAINIKEMDKLVTDKDFIIIKKTYDCFCYKECTKKTEYYYIRGDNITYRFVIEQLIEQGLELDCDHHFLEGFNKSSGSDCQFEISTGS
jgi:hypothetical protein